MSSIQTRATASAQPAQARPDIADRQACPPMLRARRPTVNITMQRSAAMDHYIKSLVYHTLEVNPLLLIRWLHEHEAWLSKYLYEFYKCKLPPPKGHVSGLSMTPSPGRQPVPRKLAGATSPRPTADSILQATKHEILHKPHGTAQMTSSNTSRVNNHHYSTPISSSSNPTSSHHQQRTIEPRQLHTHPEAPHPSTDSQDSSVQHQSRRESMSAQRSTNYQKATVENEASCESTDDCHSNSPRSTSSQSSAWPTEKDLSIPYPAPDENLLEEASLPRGTGYKWTFEEQDMAIGYMWEMHNDPKMPRTEKRFEEVSRRMMQEKGIERSKNSVKNMWNRIGRHRSKLDERKNKSAPLATSMQGKQARLENEVKKTAKRKTSEEPSPEPLQKKLKSSALIDPTLTASGSWEQLPPPDSVFATDLAQSVGNNVPPNKPTCVRPQDIWPRKPTEIEDTQYSEGGARKSSSTPKPSPLDAELDNLFSGGAAFGLDSEGALDPWDQNFASMVMGGLTEMSVEGL